MKHNHPFQIVEQNLLLLMFWPHSFVDRVGHVSQLSLLPPSISLVNNPNRNFMIKSIQ